MLNNVDPETGGIVYLDTVATLGYFVELVPEAIATSLIERVNAATGG